MMVSDGDLWQWSMPLVVSGSDHYDIDGFGEAWACLSSVEAWAEWDQNLALNGSKLQKQ